MSKPCEGYGEIADGGDGPWAKRQENIAPRGLLYQVAPVPEASASAGRTHYE